MCFFRPMGIAGLCFFIILPSGYAEKVQNREQLQQEIKTLDSRLTREEKKAAAARQQVRLLEKKLGEQTRKSYALEKKIKKVAKRLKQTSAEKEVLQSALKLHKKGLSQQMQALYSAGEQSHLRLLLKQDDPSDIGRTVKYFEYLNDSRLKKIKSTKETLEKLDKIEEKIVRDKNEYQRLNGNLLIEKKASKKTLALRSSSYKKLKKNVDYKKRQLRELKRKEANLQNKINRLVARSENSLQSSKQLKRNKKGSKKEVLKKKGKKEEITVGKQQRFVADRRFSSLRGKLSWPVKGKIIHSYGNRRNEKQRWKGTVIKAPGGHKVRAVARGKVEFSGWFNGYGYLVIIRHDNNYRSLYGYNRAVYVKSGQVVKGGTTIASVGNSGGQQKNALYFEIRKGTTPRNPAKWCR